RKVNEAEGLIGKVKSLTEVQQLQAELAVVRDLLNTARVRLGTVVPAPSGEPGLPIPAPAPSGGLPLPTPSVPGSPQPSSSSGGGGLLPPLPSLLPSLPLPSIKLPL
uniref:hypothetical protein n=1 Tax=Allorhizocola rhizosphaerae TaxID=1872709 RepID=UPI001B8C1A7C